MLPAEEEEEEGGGGGVRAGRGVGVAWLWREVWDA
jgi:hypothetical protein